MSKQEVRQMLSTWRACEDALNWLEEQPHYILPEEAWQKCPKPSWALWTAAKAGVDYKRIAGVLLDILGLLIPSYEAEADEASKEALSHILDALRAWLKGEGEIGALRDSWAPSYTGEGRLFEHAVTRLINFAGVSEAHDPSTGISEYGARALYADTTISLCMEQKAHDARADARVNTWVSREDVNNTLMAFEADIFNIIRASITWRDISKAIHEQEQTV